MTATQGKELVLPTDIHDLMRNVFGARRRADLQIVLNALGKGVAMFLPGSGEDSFSVVTAELLREKPVAEVRSVSFDAHQTFPFTQCYELTTQGIVRRNANFEGEEAWDDLNGISRGIVTRHLQSLVRGRPENDILGRPSKSAKVVRESLHRIRLHPTYFGPVLRHELGKAA